jgi:acetyltransferase-like isoleucine patch superfamily enzyme
MKIHVINKKKVSLVEKFYLKIFIKITEYYEKKFFQYNINCLKYIGKNNRFFKNIFLNNPENIEIGDNNFIGNNVILSAYSKIIIGNNCAIAAHCKIISGNHGYDDPVSLINDQPIVSKPIIIGSNVWMGYDVIILAGVSIGNGVVIGAGSVVTKSIPDYAVAVGNPAKIISYRY